MLGRFLFRWRGVIGLAAFGVLFWLARPTFGSCFAGVPFLLAGLAVRFWASGYIGIEGRAREIGASRKIVNGPYRLLRHPLYIGNFLLVAGMLVALRPSTVVIVAVLVLFVVEYSLIVIAEEADLKGVWSGESRVVSRESLASAAPVGQFSTGRAICEWRTWVATSVAFGLALLKASVAAR